MTARGTWKRRERDVAKALGGERKPVSGRVQHEADVVSQLFVVQVKHGRRRPQMLQDWLSGICGQAKDGQVGIVVWADNHERLSDAVVLMRFADFQDLHGSAQTPEEK